MATRQVEPVVFGGLFNSYVETATPEGQCYAMDGAEVARGTVGARPGYGDVWSRPSANANDVGWGHVYAAYQGTKEWLAVIQASGSGTADIWAFSSTGTVLNGGAAIGTGLNAGDWQFIQYGDKIYAANATDGFFVHTVGWYSANNDTTQKYKWKAFQPEFSIGSYLDVATERPPYVARPFVATDTVAPVHQDYEPWYYLGGIVGTALKFTTASGQRGGATGSTGMIVTFASAVDLSDVDYVYWEVRPINGRGNPVLPDLSSVEKICQFAISEDAATGLSLTDPNNATNRTFALSMTYAVKVEVTGTELGTLYYRANIGNIANSLKDATRRIMFKVPCVWYGAGLEAELTNVVFGAKDLWTGYTDPAPAIGYAFRYQNPTTGDTKPATRATLGATLIQGYSPNGNTLPLGSWPKLTPTVDATFNTAGYTNIQVFREATLSVYPGASPPPSSKRWKLITTLSNTGTPTYRDTNTEVTITGLTPGYELSFGDVPVLLNPTGIALWKSHVVLLMDRKAYFSWAGLPMKYLPPPDNSYNPPEETDLVQGRTLYVSDDRTDDMVAAGTQDVLYLVGTTGSYCMIGDSALDATPARRLPTSRGAVSKRAVDDHENGVIVGATDGLWYYEVTRAFTGSSDGTYRVEELTRTVRESWRRLLSGGSSGLVVLSANDEIWAFCAGRYLRLTRPDPGTGARTWEEGHFTQPVSLVYVPSEGVRGQLANGKLARFFYDSSGVAYTTDNGTAITWSASTGWIAGGRRRVAAIEMVGAGTPTVTIEADDGLTGIVTTTVQKVSGQRWARALSVRPGSSLRVTASGTSVGDRLDSLMFITEPIGPGEGS